MNGVAGAAASWCVSGPTPKATVEKTMRTLATELGDLNGLGAGNHALVNLTAQISAVAGQYPLLSSAPITFAAPHPQFLAFSANVAAVCRDGGAGFIQPVDVLYITDPGQIEMTGQINPCSFGGLGTMTSLPGLSFLYSGNQIGFQIRDMIGGGLRGNDQAFDDLKIWDVTPQLDESFSPAFLFTGGVSRLTFTVTNTNEYGAKNGWSFTDTLPSDLTLAASVAPVTTCPGGAVTAAAGGTKISVSGNLSQGMGSCTVSVNVTSTKVGTYGNGPTNVTETGLNPPGTATVRYVTPAP